MQIMVKDNLFHLHLNLKEKFEFWMEKHSSEIIEKMKRN